MRLARAPPSHARAAAHLSHTAQWESARLEAEARLAREARLRALAASASVSAPPGPSAAAHGGLESPTSTLSFSESAALASVLEAHGAAAAAAAAARQQGVRLRCVHGKSRTRPGRRKEEEDMANGGPVLRRTRPTWTC